MSSRLTYGQIKNYIGQPVLLSGDNPNLLPLVNEAIETLWSIGDWIGKNQRYKIRVTADCHGNKCITWPMEIETIEAVNICNQTIGIRNQYFEFQNNAVGQIGANGWNSSGYRLGWGAVSLVGDRAEVVTNEEIIPGLKRVRVNTERIETQGRILILGYDDNGNWIRTQNSDGAWCDGEYLNLADAPDTTQSFFSKITGVQFDVTPRNGATYLYSIDSDNAARQLAAYPYSISTPVFRRSIISGLPSNQNQCECVTVLAKMRFMPIIFDTDYPQISNIAALKSMLHYIYKRDNDKIQEAEFFKQEAVNILNDELKQYDGYGAMKNINFKPASVWAASPNLQ